MKQWFFPTAFTNWGEDEQSAIAAVIQSGRFTMGAHVEGFEHELAAVNKRKHAVMVNSGSSANLLAVAAIDIARHTVGTPLTEYARSASVPALAWGTTYAPLVQNGYDLVLEDCDDTWCQAGPMLYGDLYVAASILGNPGKEDVLGDADINDDCEAFGATINGRPTAAYGTIATQSFFWSHQLSAIEGGACLTDDDDLARTMRMLRDHGLTRSVQKPTSFDEEYDFRLFGFNLRPLEMHAAIARVQLLKAHGAKAARRRNWTHFAAAVADLPVKLPPLADGASPFSLHFEVSSERERAALVNALRANGIDCRLPTGGSFRLHKYGEPWRAQETPRADKIHRTGLFLGNAPFDIPDRIDRAAMVMREVFAWSQ